MQVANAYSGKHGRFAQGRLLFLALWLSCGAAQAAPYNIYTVGTTPDCDYLVLRDAIAAAAAQVGGTVELRVSQSEIKSLGYSWASSEVHITNAEADIRIHGGYDSCSAEAPADGGYTALTYFNAATDAPHTLLSISNSPSSGVSRHRVTLKHIRMVGAFDDSLGGPTFGGALAVFGNVQVELDDSEVSGFHASLGGGIMLSGSGDVPTTFPKLVLSGNSNVSSNTAGSGGGIASLLGRVDIQGAQIIGNTATTNGGGIYLVDREDAGDFNDSDNVALVVRDSSTPNSISYNLAGGTSYASGLGYGGGIYSRFGHMDFKSQAGSGSLNSFVFNAANFGGAIHAEGPNQPSGGSFALIRIRNAQFYSNKARSRGGALHIMNAVDAIVDNRGGVCTAPCSGFSHNITEGTDGAGNGPRGGAIYLRNARTDGASRPIARFYGNTFDANSDPNGQAAVAAATGSGSQMLFNRNIFINNHASTDTSSLISSANGENVNFRYNTVLDSNTSSRMFTMTGGRLDVTGSILWGTPDRSTPFHFVWYKTPSATMTHGGCLLVRASDDGMADVPVTPAVWAGYAPQLDARYAPRGSSPAIDHCDAIGGAPPADAYGHGVYDVPGVEARWTLTAPYNFDLGAVEQTDIIFANMFGNRPDN